MCVFALFDCVLESHLPTSCLICHLENIIFEAVCVRLSNGVSKAGFWERIVSVEISLRQRQRGIILHAFIQKALCNCATYFFLYILVFLVIC